MTLPLTPYRVRAIRRVLLKWYEANGADFPWRTNRDPYAALVAAVCAQQTQMSRVLEVYERWMAAFPTLAAAAHAEVADVLRAWDGAGYPRRALNLRAAARVCLEAHDGALPRDPEALLALPGVGPFTAAIVRCFGYGEAVAAVDTNVVRVLGRVVHGDLQPAADTPPAIIAATAQRLLPRAEAARWNPALMDFGARVCLPRPRCEACPVARHCAARPRFAAGELARPLHTQPHFEGSDRQWRGRILRHLRAHPGPVRIRSLEAALAPTPEQRPAVSRLLATLVADGLAWSQGAYCGLGEAPAVARTLR